MKKVSLAEVKRIMQSNIGREITAKWPGSIIYGNGNNTRIAGKKESRIIQSVTKSGVINMKTPRGISELRFSKGDIAYMGDGIIQLFDARNELCVSYLF